jgi:hypothetical protein
MDSWLANPAGTFASCEEGNGAVGGVVLIANVVWQLTTRSLTN